MRMPASLRSLSRLVIAGAFALGVVVVGHLPAIVRQFEIVGPRARCGHRVDFCPCRCSVRRFLPSFCIRPALSSTRMISPLLIDADAVGHLLGLPDVVRGEDDGDAGGLQRPHHLPPCPLRSSTSTPAVGSSRNMDLRLRATALSRSFTPARFMPPDSVTILASFLSHSDRSFSTFSI